MIRFSHVSRDFPRSGHALNDVSFHIRKGEFVFMTGHSGAGKTTALRMIHAADLPTDGEVRVFFELNGQPRTVKVQDTALATKGKAHRKAGRTEHGDERGRLHAELRQRETGAPPQHLAAQSGVVLGGLHQAHRLLLIVDEIFRFSISLSFSLCHN